MFRNDAQTARACRALLSRMPGLRDLWGEEDRPSRRYVRYIEDEIDRAATSEQALMAVAGALWNGHGPDVPIRSLMQLDNGNLRAVCSLLSAVADGPEAIDAWLAGHEEQPGPMGDPRPEDAQIQQAVQELGDLGDRLYTTREGVLVIWRLCDRLVDERLLRAARARSTGNPSAAQTLEAARGIPVSERHGA